MAQVEFRDNNIITMVRVKQKEEKERWLTSEAERKSKGSLRKQKISKQAYYPLSLPF